MEPLRLMERAMGVEPTSEARSRLCFWALGCAIR